MQAEIINRPVAVQASWTLSGEVKPLSFVWQGRSLRITGLGRRWLQDQAGVTWQSMLVQTCSGDVVELRYQMETHQWLLARAWWRRTLC